MVSGPELFNFNYLLTVVLNPAFFILQNKLNCTQLRSIVSTAQNGKSKSPSTLSPPAPGPQSVTNRFTLPRLAFTPVRCNTAFGVIDTESEINSKMINKYYSLRARLHIVSASMLRCR